MSRFVSGGTNEEPTERDEAWLKAQQEIEAKQVQKAELGKQNDGKSLYETLQANKAAKQEQFEESIRLKNQFQSLNEDEVEFLDSVLEAERAKEAAVKKQTREELEAFRKQQEEAERAVKPEGSPEAVDVPETTSWHVNRKRKKGREDLLVGSKLRKTSAGEGTVSESSTAAASSTPPASRAEEAPGATSEVMATDATSKRSTSQDTRTATSTAASTAGSVATVTKTPSAPGAGLGLAAYSSDEDD